MGMDFTYRMYWSLAFHTYCMNSCAFLTASQVLPIFYFMVRSLRIPNVSYNTKSFPSPPLNKPVGEYQYQFLWDRSILFLQKLPAPLYMYLIYKVQKQGQRNSVYCCYTDFHNIRYIFSAQKRVSKFRL